MLPAATHTVLHEINTSGRPVASKYRRLDADKLAAAKEEFRSLEKQGIIRRSSSSWASPLHMVKKTDGSWRPCGDFRRLNLQTEPDRYSVLNIADLTAKLHGVFSKLDLRKGYHQVLVKPADVPKTAICILHAIRIIQIYSDAILAEKCWSVFPGDDGRRVCRPGLLFHLHGRHPGHQRGRGHPHGGPTCRLPEAARGRIGA